MEKFKKWIKKAGMRGSPHHSTVGHSHHRSGGRIRGSRLENGSICGTTGRGTVHAK